jgi:predicted metal-binding protein
MVDIEPLCTLHLREIRFSDIIFDERVRSYCKIPYQGHKMGCPNYNSNRFCPPKSPTAREMSYELSKYSRFYLLYLHFDFKTYQKLMREEWSLKNPEVTEKQIKCVLYWQGAARALLKKRIDELRQENTFFLLTCGSGFCECASMEAVGINVFETFKQARLEMIERNPTNYIILSCLLVSKQGLKRRINKTLI